MAKLYAFFFCMELVACKNTFKFIYSNTPTFLCSLVMKINDAIILFIIIITLDHLNYEVSLSLLVL